MKNLVLLLFLSLSSCATHLKTTELSPSIPPNIKSLKQRNFSFITKKSSTLISGQHHEGLLQVPQPWIFGLSSEQKDLLRNNASDLAAESLIDELKKSGLSILSDNSKSQNYELWTLEVTQIKIDTYGDGYKGFGSAGNYWKAQITFIFKTNKEATPTEFTIQKEAVVSPSPTNMTAETILNLIQFALKPSPLSLPKATYELTPQSQTPIDIAARLAARDLISKIFFPNN